MKKSSPSPKSVKRSKSKVAKKSHPNPMADAIGQALDADKNRAQQKYDGVVGTLPDWVPEPLQGEFKATRDYLLDYFADDPASPHTKVKKLVDARKKESFPTGFSTPPYIPPEIERDLDALIYIQQIVSLKKDKGINAYLGKDGIMVVRGVVENARQKEISKNRRLDALQKLIIEIVRKELSITTAGVLAALKTHIDGPVIEYIDEEENIIEWNDRNLKAPSKASPKSTPISGIKNRVIRAKKVLSVR